jgi:3-oxoacyl-(acyl-carrier-protein) synthase
MLPSYAKGPFKDGITILGVGVVDLEKDDLNALVGNFPRYRKMDRFTQALIAAACRALKDAEITLPSLAGAVVATLYGPMQSTEKYLQEIKEHGAHLASAFHFPNTVMNMATGMLSINLGIKGPTLTLAGEIDAALKQAADFIRQGRAGIMLAGYVEEKNHYFPTEEGAVVYVLNGKGKTW